MAEPTGSILYLPHGGGPMPLMGDPGHAGLTAWLRSVPDVLGRPEAILLVSAHWEEPTPTVQTAAAPWLLFDYGGFPPETYHYTYPAPGQPQVAQRVSALETSATSARVQVTRVSIGTPCSLR